MTAYFNKEKAIPAWVWLVFWLPSWLCMGCMSWIRQRSDEDEEKKEKARGTRQPANRSVYFFFFFVFVHPTA